MEAITWRSVNSMDASSRSMSGAQFNGTKEAIHFPWLRYQ